MNAADVRAAMRRIAKKMEENKAMLIELDRQNGDGDLGLSMASGFSAIAEMGDEEADLGRLFMQMSRRFNECAPSSLGTILSFGMMGMAQALKGCTEMTMPQLTDAMYAGLDKIMSRAGSKPGEKTVLDALFPAVTAMEGSTDKLAALRQASLAAAKGAESTREMRAVHGRAAYYGDNSIGLVDGGAVVGQLIFAAIAEMAS